MAACFATPNQDDLLNLSSFVWVFKSGIWLGIPETLYHELEIFRNHLNITIGSSERKRSFPLLVTWAGEGVGSRERAPA